MFTALRLHPETSIDLKNVVVPEKQPLSPWSHRVEVPALNISALMHFAKIFERDEFLFNPLGTFRATTCEFLSASLAPHVNQSCRKEKTYFSSKLRKTTEKIVFLPSGAQRIENSFQRDLSWLERCPSSGEAPFFGKDVNANRKDRQPGHPLDSDKK